jgi:hypothetical protein
MKRCFLECCMCLCMYIFMYVPWLEPERLDGFYSYSVFKSLSVTDRCPANMDILAPKIGALQMGPQNKTANSSKRLCRFRLSLSNSPKQSCISGKKVKEKLCNRPRGPTGL